MADPLTDCPECGHRADAHLAGEQACLMPGCRCSIAADKRPADPDDGV